MKSLVMLVLMGAVLGFGLYYTYDKYLDAAPAAVPQVAAAPTPEQKKAAQVKFAKHFQQVLDDFIKNVQTKATDYKMRRKVVIELVRPENLGNPTYVQENQALMETLIPELKTKMDEIMAEFNKAETDIREAVTTQPEDKQQEIINKWRSVRDKQASHYLAFFASEQEVLRGYQEMMQFYKDRQGAYIYDDTTQSLLFNNPADKPAEQALREQIKQLESEQAETMRRASESDQPEAVPVTSESAMPPPSEE